MKRVNGNLKGYCVEEDTEYNNVRRGRINNNILQNFPVNPKPDFLTLNFPVFIEANSFINLSVDVPE